MTTDLRGAKVLITGPTGQVAAPIALALAAGNEVWGIARFSDAAARERLEAAGVHCVRFDLARAAFDGGFDSLPDDFEYVLNFAVSHGGDGDFDRDLAINAEATGLLMHHCRSATAFLQCSSTAVYQPAGHHALRETDPLGDNHRVLFPTYSICKIAAEAAARTGAREWNLPTTIARLNVPYGDHGGWPAFHLEMMIAGQPVPVHTDAPSVYNPIHQDDLVAQVPKLLDAAGVPATIVNWGGNDAVSIEDWCGYLGELSGLTPELVSTDQTLESVTVDTTRMHELIGETTVHWKDGFRRMVAARHPELLTT